MLAHLPRPSFPSCQVTLIATRLSKAGQHPRSSRQSLAVTSSGQTAHGSSPVQQCRQSRRDLLLSGALFGAVGSGTFGLQQVQASPGPEELPSPTADKEPFLQSTGGRGPLSQEEARLLELRRVREREAQRELQTRIEELEAQIQAADTKANPFCATPNGVDVLGITEFIALLGALVGGLSARQRKSEVERLNNRLRDINLQLRRQARAGVSYAPGLTYAPASVSSGMAGDAIGKQDAEAAEPSKSDMQISTVEEEMGETPTQEEVEMTRTMKEGKRLLKESNGPGALVRFEKAVMLSRATGSKIMQRRAFRGLAAAERLQGQRMAAIRHLEVVLQISKEIGDSIGDADAYGCIADIYADMNDFDNAAKYYDMYLEEMRKLGNIE